MNRFAIGFTLALAVGSMMVVGAQVSGTKVSMLLVGFLWGSAVTTVAWAIALHMSGRRL